MSFTKDFLQETIAVIEALDSDAIEEIAVGLAAVREREGRLFILGVGGSAGHASHARSWESVVSSPIASPRRGNVRLASSTRRSR